MLFYLKNAFVEVHMMQKLNYICFGDFYIPDIRFIEQTKAAVGVTEDMQ